MTNVPDVLHTPAPRLSREAVAAIVAEHWAVDGAKVDLVAGERDLIAMVGDRWALKVSNPAEDEATVEMEAAALVHVARADPALPVPLAVLARDGRAIVTVPDE